MDFFLWGSFFRWLKGDDNRPKRPKLPLYYVIAIILFLLLYFSKYF